MKAFEHFDLAAYEWDGAFEKCIIGIAMNAS